MEALRHDILHGDCLALLKEQPGNSVDLIATDPPYFRVKGEAWDNQWSSGAKFLEWIEALCVEWKRVLKPNGSLYVFASPQMSHGVEGVIRKHFNVLNNIRWQKEAGWHNKTRKEDLRSFLSPWEACIYAEHFGADSAAKGERGKGFIFAPLLSYFQGEFERAMLPRKEVDAYLKTANVCQYWLQERDFIIPTKERYEALQLLRPAHFRQQYEELRRQYEELRRPFAVTTEVPTADIWNFPAVQPYKGKHVCEKPAALMEHIIASSSRPGAVVLDCFMGSNATGKAARKLGRAFIGMELDPHWVAKASDAVPAVSWQDMPRPVPGLAPAAVVTRQQQRHTAYQQLPLFADA